MFDIYYNPLPNFLEIKQSDVHGLGLFTKKDLPNDYVLGISHIRDERFEGEELKATYTLYNPEK
jgi:hypothetical protein